MKNIQNLHCHTTTSDGELNYSQVLKVCQKKGIAVVAFTDHDSLPSKKIDILLKNKIGPTKWIIGVEINSGWPKEIGAGPGSAFDIVGLFVDPFDDKLVEYCKKTQAARISRMEKIVKNLKNLGFKISAKDCLTASGGEAVGRPHIVKALKFDESNFKILEKIKNKMALEAENNPELKNKYETMIKQGGDQYWYALLLGGNESFIPGIVDDYEYWVDMDQAVALIRNAGGLAFLAHYFTIRKVIAPEIIEKFICQKRFDGLETVFCLYSKESGMVFKKYVEECRDICKGIVKKFACLQSGGNDAHSEKALIDFADDKSFSEETIGMAEKIIKKSKVSTNWSSFS